MKKRLMIVALLAALAAFPLAAQTTFSDYEDSFQKFTDGLAQALPLLKSATVPVAISGQIGIQR